MIDFIVISIVTQARSLLSSPVALQDMTRVSVALFLQKCK
jgi:hypothetical protein